MIRSNKYISLVLEQYANALEYLGDTQQRIRSYQKASDYIYGWKEEVSNLTDKQLLSIPSIGKSMLSKIEEIKSTGTFKELEDIKINLSTFGLQLFRIKGVGLSKAKQIVEETDINSLEALKQIITQNKFPKLKGFTDKALASILDSIELYEQSAPHFYLDESIEEAKQILEELSALSTIQKIELTGAIRRCDALISQLEFLYIGSFDVRNVSSIIEDEFGIIRSASFKIPVLFIKTTEEKFAQSWLLTTATDEHIQYLDMLEVLPSEEAYYHKKGFPYIIPEMRDSQISPKQAINVIQQNDIIGCLHNHTTHSDGLFSVEEMAKECIRLGLTYFGTADHSKSAYYANGIGLNRLEKYFEDCKSVDESLDNFKLFCGIESDILKDGGLDYDDGILKQFDYIVASIHSGLEMSKEDATKRLVKAIENPRTHILGHLSGRLLKKRNGYDLDYSKIIEACKQNAVIIEINANPWRLDIDYKYLKQVVDSGVMLSINPDAHEYAGIKDMQYGVMMARKAGIEKESILNTYTATEVEAIFNRKR